MPADAQWLAGGLAIKLLDASGLAAPGSSSVTKPVNVAAGRCYEAAGFRPDQHIVSKPIGG